MLAAEQRGHPCTCKNVPLPCAATRAIFGAVGLHAFGCMYSTLLAYV